jgi:outer membrane lipoprotein-sorting protein
MFACLVLLGVSGAGCGANVESYGEGMKVLKWMKAPSKRIERLQASALLLQQGPKGTFRGDAYVFYKAPSSLRIDILGPVSNLIGVFIFKEGRGMVLDYTRGSAVLSDDGGCLFSRFMGTDVVLPEFSEVFLGMPPVIPFDESELRWKSKGYYILDLRDSGSGVVEKIQLTRGIFGTVVIRAVVFKNQKKMVDMSFRKRGWKSDVSPLMPRIVEVGFVQEKMQLLFKYKNVELNGKISDHVFDEPVPQDFTVETLSCEGS